MGELLPSQPRPTGPRILRDWEQSKCPTYYADGITGTSPSFGSKQEGEAWLRTYLANAPLSKRPQVRCCMRCQAQFKSEGFHNRMCVSCRNVAANDDTSVFRIIRPSKRG